MASAAAAIAKTLVDHGLECGETQPATTGGLTEACASSAVKIAVKRRHREVVSSPRNKKKRARPSNFQSLRRTSNGSSDLPETIPEMCRVYSKTSLVSESDQNCSSVANTGCCKESECKHSEEPREEGENCLICMDPFTIGNPAIKIPCSKKCNVTPVHARCIYEWREGQTTQNVGSCPLCRSPLDKVEYSPPDVIRSNTFNCAVARKQFLTSPLPKEAGVVRCYIKAYRSGLFSTMSYELYLQAPTTLKYPLGPLPSHSGPRDGDRLLAVARKSVTSWGATQLDMSMDTIGRDSGACSEGYLGFVRSSFSGLEHEVLAPRTLSDGSTELTSQLAAIRYTQNRIRSTVGPRKVHVCLPNVRQMSRDRSESDPLIVPAQSVRENGFSGKAQQGINTDVKPCSSCSTDHGASSEVGRWYSDTYVSDSNCSLGQQLNKATLNSEDDRTDVMFATNKEPYWLDAIQAYSLDFQGRVTLPSNKNFQLLMTKGQNETEASDDKTDEVVLQFGKVEDNKVVEVYTMDVQWPLSPLQAFGICLSACDRKLLSS